MSKTIAAQSAGGGFGMPGGAHGLGIGTIIILGLVGWALGIDPSVLINGAQILSGGGQIEQQNGPPPVDDARTAETKDFVAAVLGDTEDRWTDIFNGMGQTYHPPRLRLFSGAIDGGCGMAQSAMGPFYCPQDKNIYLDMSFFQDMQNKFDACASDKACRFSEAYVIAHEVGHHVQDELGLLHTVQAQQASSSQTASNALAGAHRAAGGLLCRRVGEPRPAEAQFPRSGRRRSGFADRVRHRRRPPAEGDAGLCRARQLHPRHLGAAQALVLERL